MDLLIDRWIPARGDGGTGEFRLLSLEELLCSQGNWWVSLPRDDLELACIQLLVCMTQVMFMPESDPELRQRLRQPLSPESLADGIAPCTEWFDLDHPTQPFMQTRGLQTEKVTPIQKLLVGLPEGNNHAFFNQGGEVRRIGGPVAAIALFNLGSNTPSYGTGFKGNLRGGSNPFLAPITSLVIGENLRDTVWHNVVTRSRLRGLFGRMPDASSDKPTWIEDIHGSQQAAEIDLARGLFWQSARLELVLAGHDVRCDLLGGENSAGYAGFRIERSLFKVENLWPHPHGVRVRFGGKDRFASFSSEAPSWTQLSEFLVPNPWDEDAKEGSVPAAPVNQAADIWPDRRSHLLVGGYRTRISSVIERRHDLFSLAEGWARDRDFIKELVKVGKESRSALRSALVVASKGYEDRKRNVRLKGIGTIHKKNMTLLGLHDVGDRLFYSRTEPLFHESLGKVQTFQDRQRAKLAFCKSIARTAEGVFEDLTSPYANVPELIGVVAFARSRLHGNLSKLTGGKADVQQRKRGDA